jgi:mono/diheme cytochrome c family protein
MIMCEGVFLRSSIETPYGPIRGTNGGFFRYDPNRRHLERHAQLSIPNPWGVAFDAWGQHFFLHTSGTTVEWMLPGTVKSRYGIANPRSKDLIEPAHKVRPTSGIEFLYSSHFPDEVQGDMLLNNNIGYLGTKQHQMIPEGTGYKTKHRQDLVTSEDGNFRPVDLEVAPDGSLYIVDWHNPLIGHMQHNARDPNRDHTHGRVYRITYPSRPLVQPAQIAGASIKTLLDNLKLHEYRSRYRTRRELRGRKASEVIPAIKTWLTTLDKNDPKYDHYRLEALWVTWGLSQIDQTLLKELLSSEDHRARAAAVRVLRYNTHKVSDHVALFKKAASDSHGRVIMESITAASWLPKNEASAILTEATIAGATAKVLNDDWLKNTYNNAVAHANGEDYKAPRKPKIKTDLKGEAKKLFMAGAKIYAKEGHCETCHQHDGNGLTAAGFPPLSKTKWVNQDPERLIKITLNGLHGPIEVKGKKYPGQVPMTPFGGMLKDYDIAAVLTYVKNSFGNKSGVITPDQVKKVRAATKDKVGFYSPEELLKMHPHK